MNRPDYGYGKTPDPVVPPKVVHHVHDPCPSCGGKCMYMIQAIFKLDDTPNAAMLKRPDGIEHGVGNYLGCAACQFASPMMMRAATKEEEEQAG